jgi:hypothetical protein
MDSRQKQILEYRSYPRGYYHLCTDGLKGGLIFNNDKQYAFGMFLMGIILS